MKKTLKITLTTAVLITNSFAVTSVFELKDNGEIQHGGTLQLNNQTISISKDKSLNVYGSIAGEGTIDCSKGGEVHVFNDLYVKAETGNAETIKSGCNSEATNVYIIKEGQSDHISENVTISPSTALKNDKESFASAASKKTNNDLFYIANKEGSNVNCIGGETQTTVISAALGNAGNQDGVSIEAEPNSDGYTLYPAGIVMTNKLKFTGDNSGYTQKEVKIGTTEAPAEVEYAGEKSHLLAPTTVEAGSKLIFSGGNRVTLGSNITINQIKGRWNRKCL